MRDAKEESTEHEHGGLQPVVLPATLAAFDGTPAAAELKRLAGDIDLLHMLMWNGFTGSSWDRFARACAEYGIVVLSSWCRSGLIFVQSARKGYGGLPRVEIGDDDATELALETVAVAIQRFREDVLIPRKWDPARGASLKTYFIGQCIFRFPNVYRRWLGELEQLPLSQGIDEAANLGGNPEVLARIVRGWRAIPDPVQREIVAMKGDRYTNGEIAKAVGMTEKAVERRLARHRGKESW